MARTRTEVTPEAQVAAEKAGTGSVSVFDKNAQFVRTYTAADHGEGFIALAEGFAKKIGGVVKKT